MLKIAILASGKGTNALALNEVYQSNYSKNAFIITENKYSPLAEEWMYLAANNKQDFEKKLLNKLFEYECDWLFLAGFMKVLSSHFLQEFHSWHKGVNQVVNIHPSMLPELKGLHAYERAWEESYEETGVSIHYVDTEVDSGEMILQKKLKVDKKISMESWIDNSKKIENKMYQQVLQDVIDGKILSQKFQRLKQ